MAKKAAKKATKKERKPRADAGKPRGKIVKPIETVPAASAIAEINELKKELQESQRNVLSLETEKQALVDDVKNIETANVSLKTENEELKKKAELTGGENSTDKETITFLQNQINKLVIGTMSDDKKTFMQVAELDMPLFEAARKSRKQIAEDRKLSSDPKFYFKDLINFSVARMLNNLYDMDLKFVSVEKK